ncbi:uncharacterized protein [Halyomorpha halys]|uniref:uncharacterized protein n=1 Tax=Halyomorpha halys TaxID=286706 RepID=UPI0006D4F432|nr:uncharacterized protein LOC106681986 [Halyomorpha halys]
MDNSNNETCLETPHPPHKKARYWEREELEALKDEDTWYRRMTLVKERNLVRAVYDNAMNSLIEGSGCLGEVAVEDEAVSMAIRCHGLACTANLIDQNHTNWPAGNASTSTSGLTPCSATTEDILSHAVSAAIRKKGLGAVDR